MTAQELRSNVDAGTPESAPVKLTKAQVVAAGREAFLARRLQAQQPGFWVGQGCKYRSDTGIPCVVGAAIDDATAHLLDNQDEGSIGVLIVEGLVKTNAPAFLRKLQKAHDGGDLPRLAKLLGLPADGASSASTTDDGRAPGMNP